jgi:hypothetical protein
VDLENTDEYVEKIKTQYGIDVINDMTEAVMYDFNEQFAQNFEIA